MSRILLFIGGLFALLSVALGAMGAHLLKKHLSDSMLDIFKTGASYQLTQALGLILIGVLLQINPKNRIFSASGILLIIGIVIFSGSLYAYSFTNVVGWAKITPIGGLFFLMGWVVFLTGVSRLKKIEGA